MTHINRYFLFDFFFIVLPKIIPFGFGASPIFAGQPIQVTCLVMEGDSPLSITWSFNTKEIPESGDVTTIRARDNLSMMLIDAAKAHHTGTYTCSVKNPAGMSNYSADLQINGNQRMELFTDRFIYFFKSLHIPYLSTCLFMISQHFHYILSKILGK